MLKIRLEVKNESRLILRLYDHSIFWLRDYGITIILYLNIYYFIKKYLIYS